jgi:acetoin utilization deacetylase AcuC-like enzyme
MPVAFITHPACRLHNMGDGHPEQPARLDAIEELLHVRQLYDFLVHHEAPRATFEQLARVHPRSHIEQLSASSPNEGLVRVDPDTAMCPDTFEAALRAAGANVLATDLVIGGHVRRAFCNVRPPGHHAERAQAMGFCFFNNVAVAAAHALEAHALERVAIVDFDVHHGNGTEDIFKDEPRVMLCSTFQHPFYPYCGGDTVSDHIVNVPLPAGTTGNAYREAFSARILPRLESFRPQMLFFSAGFDGHREDDMAQFGLMESDYIWITEQVMDVAARYAEARIVSVLEGGYDLSSLGRSAAAHIKTLADL